MDISTCEICHHDNYHVIISLIIQPFFFGIFETRLSTMALCDLLRHCVATSDQILCGLTLHEDIISDMSGVGVVTRSQRSTAG